MAGYFRANLAILSRSEVSGRKTTPVFIVEILRGRPQNGGVFSRQPRHSEPKRSIWS